MKCRAVLQIPKQALWGFLEDNGFTLAGALAFYAMLSLAPLLVLLVTVVGSLSPETEQRLVAQTEQLIGPQASQGVQLIVSNARLQRFAASFSAGVSLLIFALSATTVFAQLQYSLNAIFGVRPKRGLVAGWFYKRFLSLLMVTALGLVLIVTVAVTSALSVIFRGSRPVTRLIDLLVSYAVFTLVFVIMFRVLPDVKISWKDTWVGGAISGLLVVVGEYAIARYLQSSATVSIYGVTGSLVVLLLWIYYSSLIFFYGAELTRAYANCCGEQIVPSEFAEWTPEMLERQRRQQQPQERPQEPKPQEQQPPEQQPQEQQPQEQKPPEQPQEQPPPEQAPPTHPEARS
jgi:membrane protein